MKNHAITNWGHGLMGAAVMCWGMMSAASAQALDKHWTLSGIPAGETLEMRGRVPGGETVTVHIPAGTTDLVGRSCWTIQSSSHPSYMLCDVLFQSVKGQVDRGLLTPTADRGLPVYAPPRSPGQKTYNGYVPRPDTIGGGPRCERVSEPDAKTLVLHCDWPQAPAP